MAKVASETTTKTRAPSAYNVYMSEHLKPYRDTHEGVSVKDAMKEVAAMWRDAPENPNRGKTAAERKAEAKPKAPKRSTKKAAASSDEEGPQVEPGSDE
ncbi:hypothetical protein OF83DRAFT_494853 [Amylostereum chailletii]|nr:hypothetical protein OF83DRAFT_494853 [Amylostereum chailletii]